MKRLMRAAALAAAGSLMLTGCDFDVYQLPLPGGADTGDDPITVTAEFEDVLDLVPKSTVKVKDIDVGSISDIDLKPYTDDDGTERYLAEVTMELQREAEIPADVFAEIRQTSLLGEKFVSLSPPESGGTSAMLEDEAHIPLSRTGNNQEIEVVLGALSMLLSGGGVAQLKTITQELNVLLEGREDTTKSVLRQIEQFMGQLDDNKTDIVDAIEALNRLSIEVRRQQGSIDQALEELPSALDSIDRQRDDLVEMLQALSRLGDVGVRVINKSKNVTIRALQQLQPTLTNLANTGDDFVDSFNVALTFPFVDEVVGRDPQVARNLHMGDYTNLSVQLDLDLLNLPELPGIPCTPLAQIPSVPPLPDLEDLCMGAQNAIAACVANPLTCDLPGFIIREYVCAAVPIPGICPGGGGGNANNGNGGLLGGLPGLPDLPGLGSLSALGLNRPATGIDGSTQAGGPTMGQLMGAYDPALVSLLTPPMVVEAR